MATRTVTGRPPSTRPLLALLPALLVCLGLSDVHPALAAEKAKKILAGHRLEIGGSETSLHQPAAAVFGPEGKIYVLDGEENFVKIFSPSGKLLTSFGRSGHGEGLLDRPLALALSREGDIFVADTGNSRVVVFSPKGDLRSQFRLPPDRDKFPADPTGIALNETDRTIHVVDNDNHRLITLSREGKFLSEVGRVGFDRGEFRYPFRVAIDSGGDLFVTDVINTRVQILNSAGRYKGSLGDWGVDPGQLFRPAGIAVDSRGRVLVSDGYLGVVQVFERTGEILGLLTNHDGRRLTFRSATNLDLHGDGLLLVTDSLGNRVSVYAVEE